MRIGRRQFLLAAVAAAVATPTRTVSGDDADAADALRALAHPDLLTVLGPDAVGEIGRRYRDVTPNERDAAALHAAIRTAGWRGGHLGRQRPPLAALVAEDFAAGRTVVVSGWVLSATEARQCALFSLLAA